MPQNLRNAQNLIKAMKAAGQSDDLIMDRIQKISSLGDDYKKIFERAKLSGQSSKAISDFTSLPTQQVSGIREKDLETKGILGKIAKFTGVEPLGRYLGAKAAQLSPKQREIISSLESEGKTDEAKLLRTGGISGKQLAGSIAQTGLTAFGGGILGKSLKGLTSLQKIGANRLMDAAFGAAGMAQEKNASVQDILKGALTSATIGGALSAGGKLLIGAGKQVKDLPESLYSRIFKAVDSDLNAEWKSIARGKKINPTLAKEVLDEGLKGSSEKMGVYSIKKLDLLEKSLQKKASLIKDKVILTNKEKRGMINVLNIIRDRYKKGAVVEYADVASKLSQKVKTGKLSVSDSIVLKRFYDKMRNNSSFKLDPNLTMYQEDLKLVSNNIRGKIHGFKEISNLLDKERIYINALGDLLSFAVKERNSRLFNLIDVMLLGGGSMAGAPVAGFGAMAAARTFQNPAFMTPFAQTIENFINKPARRLLTKEVQKQVPILTRTLRGAVGGEVGRNL